ncbi:OCIA domain-containing protein 2 [Megalops cyprinoides]|uniref:OCIA domain-containing protein 2 n=1 Tax=Megalops cyprinoides TaxID=118141 RepID=UPI001863A190|nr:OCIA domain-containing protein 2 [Megalops cyprinoides]
MSKTTMTSEAAERGGQGTCLLGDQHVHRDEVRQIIRECQEESFWYRALPLSLGSMAITGALLYNGVLHPSKRFGPLPKLAVAGILGYILGKASYMRMCRDKFQRLGFEPFGPGFSPRFRRGFHPEHKRQCHHVCKECEKNQAPPTPEREQS